jgi:Fe2+ or Zn2+ uptake regulation protein
VNKLEKFVKILKENHLKVTPQRLAILDFLKEHPIHPTAEEIYSALKKSNPSLSKTTVYNALDSLQAHNIIQSLTITGSQQRFDFRHDTHHHFLCKKCGRIIDIEIKCPNVNKVTKFGHRVDEIHGYFKGTCKNCLKKDS